MIIAVTCGFCTITRVNTKLYKHVVTTVTIVKAFPYKIINEFNKQQLAKDTVKKHKDAEYINISKYTPEKFDIHAQVFI